VRFMPDRTVEIFRELAALESVEMSSKAKEEGTEVSSENTSVVVSPEYAARLRRHMRICTLRGGIADRREGVVQGVPRQPGRPCGSEEGRLIPALPRAYGVGVGNGRPEMSLENPSFVKYESFIKPWRRMTSSVLNGASPN